jgi:hypothetical protein
MFERAPNGFFVNDLILFNSLRRGGYIAKGFVFEAPDLTNSPIADLNDFQDQLSQLLASLQENQRLQVQYFSDSDYKAELLRYQQETGKFENIWTKRSRNERFMRYWQAMVERKLRRQRVIFYVSRSLENTPRLMTGNTKLREYYLTLLDQLRGEFEHVHKQVMDIFSSAGARILPMTDLDHYRLNTRFARFINVPELMQLFRQMADVQTAQMLNLARPKLEGEKPAIRSAPATPPLKKFVQSLVERAHRLKTERIDPSEDNMLKITSEGRKAALDLRLMLPSAKDDPQSKVNLAVENIYRIWDASKEGRLAQLVFCDLSTPKDKGFRVFTKVITPQRR